MNLCLAALVDGLLCVVTPPVLSVFDKLMRSRAQIIVRIIRNLDIVLLAAIATVVWDTAQIDSGLEFLLLLLLIPYQASLFQYFGLYESHRVEGLGLLARNLLSAQIVGVSSAVLILLIAGLNQHVRPAGIHALAGFAVIFALRVCLYAALRLLRGRGFDLRKVCVVGSRHAAEKIEERFARHPAWGLQVAYWGCNTAGNTFSRYPSNEALQPTLESLLQSEFVDEVLISARPGEIERYKSLMAQCKDYGVTARLVIEPEREEALPEEPRVEEFLGSVSLAMGGQRHGLLFLVLKRVFDVVLASMFLVLLLPVMLVISLLVKLSSPGPVFFAQKRVGRNGRQFKMHKFRTMVDGAEGLLPSLAARNITEGPVFKTRDDWRVTPTGRWLRHFSLDELPQFINVIKGEMSLVGPRPLPVAEAKSIAGPYRRRFSMRPGITCVWQVSGRSEVGFARWMKMDLEYVDNWSLWLDTKLLIQSIPAVISGRGAY